MPLTVISKFHRDIHGCVFLQKADTHLLMAGCDAQAVGVDRQA